MTSKLVPPHPEKVMVMRTIPNTNIITCSVPFSRFGRVHIGGRGTIVPLANNDLAVFSPVALTPPVQEMIATTGKVKYIVALDQEHHLFLTDWQKTYPEAKVIVPEPLMGKRMKQGMLLPADAGLPNSLLVAVKKGEQTINDPAFDAEFDMEYVHVHPNQELVFNHRPSKTLIQADLLFNLPATEQYSNTDVSPTSGILTRLFNAINHTRGDAMGQRRVQWYAMSSGDRPAFNKSIARIAGWDFDRLVPCHGDVIETGGKGVFQKVFKWHLDAVGAGAQKKSD